MKLSRRDAMAAMLAATASQLPAAEETVERAGCRIAFSTYGLPGMSLADAIHEVWKARFDSIEICVTPDRDTAAEKMSFKQRRDTQSKLASLNLGLCSLMSNLRPMEGLERHQADLERLKQDANLAHDLSRGNPPPIQTVLGGKNWNESKELCVERLADWIDVARRHEVVVAVKPHRGHAMSRPSEAAWVIEQLGNPPQLKMWFDYSHFIFRDMPMQKTIDESLPILAGVAVKDAQQVDGKVRFALPGAAGTIDYQQLCKLLFAGGFRGDICVEVSSQVWKQPEYSSFRALTDSYQELSVAMRRAGVPRRR